MQQQLNLVEIDDGPNPTGDDGEQVPQFESFEESAQSCRRSLAQLRAKTHVMIDEVFDEEARKLELRLISARRDLEGETQH
jgi:hypothetical protein